MHTKTMEGLAGASMNMKVLNTPFRVYKEAEHRGDTAVMDRAMGYIGECADRIEDYQKKAEKGMEEDAKEAKEKAKLEQEKAIQKRKEERQEQEKRIAENRDRNADTVEISENGKAALNGKIRPVQTDTDSSTDAIERTEASKMEPVIYTQTGEAAKMESNSLQQEKISYNI